MSYFRKPNPRSNWKRPKPKIYDCNTRDMETFYQSSYGEYLDTKADIRARDLDRQRRGDAETLTRRFEQRRASSLVYGEDDAPRQHRFVPSRQTSNDGSTEHSTLRTKLFNSTEDGARENASASSLSSTTRNVSFTNSLNAPDQDSEMASIESRLERLRKLREELGLPAESGGTSSHASSSVTSSLLTSTDASSSNLDRGSTSEARGRESSRFARSAARSDSRSRASPGRSGLETSSFTTRSDRGSALNGLDDTTSSYTRTSRGGDTNGLSNSTYESSTTSTRNRKRVEKPSLDDIDLSYNDDELLSDMRRKIPSSSEILEKIRKMDIE